MARALVLESPRELISRELPLPAIGDDDGLLRVEACGLCGTDHEEFTGELFPGYDALQLLAARRFPFETLPRRVVGLEDVGRLLAVMAGEGEVPPVHAVVVPEPNG